jgi:hypothetical protein
MKFRLVLCSCLARSYRWRTLSKPPSAYLHGFTTLAAAVPLLPVYRCNQESSHIACDAPCDLGCVMCAEDLLRLPEPLEDHRAAAAGTVRLHGRCQHEFGAHLDANTGSTYAALLEMASFVIDAEAGRSRSCESIAGNRARLELLVNWAREDVRCDRRAR